VQQALLVLLAQLVLPAHLVQQEPMEQTVLLAPRAIKAYKD
jgi:hypothetical protein